MESYTVFLKTKLIIFCLLLINKDSHSIERAQELDSSENINKIYNKLDPKITTFLKDLASKGGTPIYKMSYKDARAVLDDLQKDSVNTIPADVQDLTIPGGPNKNVSIRIIRPKGIQDKLPVIMYFHGGGWILGNKNTHDRVVRQIANKARAAVVFVNYTPSPEAQFPVSLLEGYAATNYISKNGGKLNLDPQRLAVVGDSVGGNMAAAVTLLAKAKGPKIDYQVLFYPVTNSDFNTESYNEFADGIWLTKNSMKWFWNAYEPIFAKRNKPLVSPLLATLDQLKGLPPALIITNEFDVLRDEGEAYAHKLMRAGVEVIAIRYLGAIHDLILLDPIKNTSAAKSAINVASEQLKKVFYRSKKK